MTTRILCFLTMILLASCQQSLKYGPGHREQSVNEVMARVSQKLKKETDLRPCGSGGQTSHGVQMLALSFDYHKPLEIEEARKLLVRVIDEFVAAVNADEQIRPYLNHFPFEPENIEIRIFVRNRDGSDVGPGKLCVVSALEGQLDYDVDNPEGPLFITVQRETYQVAVGKVKSVK